MRNRTFYKYLPIILLLGFSSCKVFKVATRTANSNTPEHFANAQSGDSSNVAQMDWRAYFTDTNLAALIDTALSNNQELNITLQEVQMEMNEVMARRGEYLPFVGLKGEAGLEKEGRYTRHGAVDEQLDIKHGTAFPEPLQDYMFGLNASWELDVWKKLRNSKKAAVSRYLASVEGKNFMVTNLIAEVAGSTMSCWRLITCWILSNKISGSKTMF